MAMNLWIKDCF